MEKSLQKRDHDRRDNMCYLCITWYIFIATIHAYWVEGRTALKLMIIYQAGKQPLHLYLFNFFKCENEGRLELLHLQFAIKTVFCK